MGSEPEDILTMRLDLGQRLVVFRRAAQLNQTQVGKAASYHRSTVAHIEAGTARADEKFWKVVDALTNADGVLIAGYAQLNAAIVAHEAATCDAELAEARRLADAHRRETRLPHNAHSNDGVFAATVASDAQLDAEDDVKRAEFLAGMVSGVTAPGIFFGESRRLGMADARRYRQNLEQLYALDDTYGSTDEVFALTVRTLRKLRRDFDQASYSPGVGAEIRRSLAS